MRYTTHLGYTGSKGKLSVSLNVIVLMIGIDDFVGFCADRSVLNYEFMPMDVSLERHCLRMHAKSLLVLHLYAHF
jgi:hypothetical protein